MVWRDLRGFRSLAANNFFLFSVLLLQQSGVFLQLLIGLLLLFPLSADPLKKIPQTRLKLWPLTQGEQALLRLGSLLLSPAAWITLGILVWRSRPGDAMRFLGLSLIIYVITSLSGALTLRRPQLNLLRHVPLFPGILGGLIQKNLREMLSVLDVYIALLLAICGVVYRFASRNPVPDAYFGLSLLIVLAISTYGQSLFGLDTKGGISRYRLMPLRGWQVLAAKDAAYFVVLLVLVLPLAPLAGLAGGCASLAVGHYGSVRNPVEQTRWRFAGGGSLQTGLIQTLLLFSAMATVFRGTLWVLPAWMAAYGASLWWYGRELDRAG